MPRVVCRGNNIFLLLYIKVCAHNTATNLKGFQCVHGIVDGITHLGCQVCTYSRCQCSQGKTSSVNKPFQYIIAMSSCIELYHYDSSACATFCAVQCTSLCSSPLCMACAIIVHQCSACGMSAVHECSGPSVAVLRAGCQKWYKVQP